MIQSSRRKQMKAYGFNETTNAGLWLDKFICNQGKDAACSDKDEKENLKKRPPKSRLVAETAAIPTPPVYSIFYDRWLAALKAIKAECWPAEVQGRMIVGLGDESVLETSVTLHRTYGVPFIPGSALKGLAAGYARNKLDGWVARDEHGKVVSVSPAYETIFGKTDEAGYLTFHDALYVPLTGFKVQVNGTSQPRALHADVLTVHHQDYYGNKTVKDAQGKDILAPPADWDDPNPVSMLSATGRYLVALSAPLGLSDDCEPFMKTARSVLELALEQEGVGAKTSSGYGRLKFTNSGDKCA